MEDTEARYYFALLTFSREYQEAFLKVVKDKEHVEGAKKDWAKVWTLQHPCYGRRGRPRASVVSCRAASLEDG